MTTRDMRDNVNPKRGISPAAAVTDNTAFVSQIFDTQGYESATFFILTGSLADADATFAVLIEDGNQANLSDNAAVAANFLNGTVALAGFDFSKDDSVFDIGYVGPKRYVRVTITPANNTGNAFVAGMWLGGHPHLKGTPNPPA